MATFRVDIDGKKVARKIDERISDGVDDAASKINDEMRKTAKAKIRSENAIFTRELLESFSSAEVKFGDSTVASLRNIADHAPYQERGVSGTQVKRKTPHQYTDKKPPLSALLPWVKHNLSGSGFWPDDLPGDGPPGDSGASRSRRTRSSDSGSGGVETSRRYSHDKLMGKDRLTVGTQVEVNTDQYGYLEGEIIRSAADMDGDFSWDYGVRATINGETGNISVRIDEIVRYDGMGADPDEVVEGTTVYVGDYDTLATVVDVFDSGVSVKFDDGGQDTLDFWQFEVVDADDSRIPLDFNGLYLGEPGYIKQDINDSFSNTDLFPYQRIVVFNQQEKEYLRGTIREFSDTADKSFKFELDAVDGSRFNVNTEQIGPYKLAGYENIDSLDTDELQKRLDDYFKNEIDDGSRWITTEWRNEAKITEADQSVLDYTREFFTEKLFSVYKDRNAVKEQIRNIEAIVSYQDSYVKQQKTVGGGVADIDGTRNYIGVFLSDRQLDNYTTFDQSYKDQILAHEQKHALTAVYQFGKKLRSYVDDEDMVEYADWDRSGNQSASGYGIDLPNHADDVLFRDNNEINSPVIGGTGWLGRAYDAAKNGDSSIQQYTPNLQTSTSEPIKRLHEAANHAWWLQAVRAREKYKSNGNVDYEDKIFVNRRYSITNPDETLATFEEVMWGLDDDWEARLLYINKYYPWLIQTWLEAHNPNEDVKDMLENLGYTV